MTLESIRDALASCSLINIVFLICWFLFMAMARDWVFRYHNKWFKLSVEAFDTMHYAGMGLYKMGIVLFNLVPYFALRIVV